MGCNCGKKFNATPAPVPPHILQEAARRMKEATATQPSAAAEDFSTVQGADSSDGK